MSIKIVGRSDDVEKPTTFRVKLETDVVVATRIVTAFRGKSTTELLDGILRQVVAKMEQEEIARRVKATKRAKGSQD